MKQLNVNNIYLTKERFGDSLYQVLGDQIKILTLAGEVCEVYEDEVGIIVINHMHRDTFNEAWGVPNPVWLTPEEQDLIYSNRERDKEDEDD